MAECHPVKHGKTLTQPPATSGGIRTIDGGEHHPGVVVGDDVCIAVLWFIHFHVGVLPGELLAWVDGLQQRRRRSGVGVGGQRLDRGDWVRRRNVEQDEGGREGERAAAQSVLDHRPQRSLENKPRHSEQQHTL